MPSLRNLKEQFGAGLDISGTRMERNLQSLETQLTRAPAASVARGNTASYLVWGYSPQTTASRPLPWLAEFNGPASYATLEPPTAALNLYRHKAVDTPSVAPASSGQLYTWEMAFVTPESCLLDQLEVDLAAELSWYGNDFVAGAVPPFGQVPGEYLRDCTVQVMFDNQLENQNRKASTVEAGVFRASMGAHLMNINTINIAKDTMVPSLPAALAELKAIHFSIPVKVLLPRNTPVRICITIPEYPAPIVTGWAAVNPAAPWAAQVWGCQARLVRPNS
jgi:hypothetical protein